MDFPVEARGWLPVEAGRTGRARLLMSRISSPRKPLATYAYWPDTVTPKPLPLAI